MTDHASPAQPWLVRATSVGFTVGSALFALGVLFTVDSELPPTVAGWTYFAGSLFFTSAAFLQFLTSRAELEPSGRATDPRMVFGRAVASRDVDWSAASIQLLGTLAFNVTTLLGALVAADVSDATADVVWRPDAVGSVLFLVSSAIALLPEVRARRHHHVRSRSWAIAWLNMVGSVFFGLSAIGAYTIGSTGELVNVRWSNAGTFLGAVCFLLGALLLYPARRR